MRKSLIDIAFCSATNGPKFFNSGLGDTDYLEKLLNRDENIGPIKPIDIKWAPSKSFVNIEVTDGKFESPVADLLPTESKTSYIRKIMPRNHTEKTPVVVHFAGTGDEGYGRRSFFLANPLARKGIGSILLEGPFYGKRRPSNQNGIYVNTVSDKFKLGHCCMEEGRSLIDYLLKEGYKKLGVTGHSMGGQISLLVGMHCHFPLAIIPCATPHSPEPVFMDEILKGSIDWSALKTQLSPKKIDVNEFMRKLFSISDLRKFPIPYKPELIHIIAGKYDAYVPTQSANTLWKYLRGSQITWLDGGHVTSLLFHAKTIRNIICETMGKL